jgi:two-component system, chemotaxis family, CheB/CheR fusion protein
MASHDKFPIVGIGASAGGLEALEGLFRAMSAETGLSFVVITHLARGHVSALVENTEPLHRDAGQVGGRRR